MSERRLKKAAKQQAREYRETLKPKTKGQEEYIRLMSENIVTFGIGPAGTGKSYCALGLASQYLLDGDVSSIIVCRPTVEASGSSKGLGFLPGDQNQKLSPYVLPAVEILKKFLGRDSYGNYVRNGTIKFEPLEYLRGRTFDNAFMIGEEFQNASTEQIKMFITRIGENSRIVIDGDISQTDIKKTNSEYASDLEYIITKVERANLKNFGVHEMSNLDIVRNKIIGPFLDIF
jgi:phosphate starvation-inducible protein PhoH and related proteins